MRKSYSAEFKAQVVKEALKEEKTFNEIASEYEIHPNMARQWRDKALAALPGVFSRKGDEEQAAEAAAYEQGGARVVCGDWAADHRVKLVSSASRSERQELVEWESQEMKVVLRPKSWTVKSG